MWRRGYQPLRGNGIGPVNPDHLGHDRAAAPGHVDGVGPNLVHALADADEPTDVGAEGPAVDRHARTGWCSEVVHVGQVRAEVVEGVEGRIHTRVTRGVCGREGCGRRCDVPAAVAVRTGLRSEEHTSELQSLMRISYAVFCLKKKI